MSTSDLVRWGAVGALLAAIAWVASGLISLVVPGQGTEALGTFTYYLLEMLFSLASLGMLAALVGFRARQAPHYGRLGTAGFLAAFIGVFLLLASTVATILAGREVLDWLFIVGFTGSLVGFVLLGVATLRASVFPRWCGVLLIVAVLSIPVYFVFGNYGGRYSMVWCG